MSEYENYSIECPNEGCNYVCMGWAYRAALKKHRRRCDAATPSQREVWCRLNRSIGARVRWDDSRVRTA